MDQLSNGALRSVELHVPVTRSSRLKAMGLVETEPRAESRVFEPLVLLNTPDGLSYIVLGRYNRTVVTWARL